MSYHLRRAVLDLLDKVREDIPDLHRPDIPDDEIRELESALDADEAIEKLMERPRPVDGKITRHQYYEAMGLLAAGRKSVEMQGQIERALGQLLGVKYDGGSYWGHASDAMYGHYGVDKLLEKLELKVEPEASG